MKRFMIMTGCVALAIAFAMPASALTLSVNDVQVGPGPGWYQDITLSVPLGDEGLTFDRIQAIATDRTWPHVDGFVGTPVNADGFADPGFEAWGGTPPGSVVGDPDGGTWGAFGWSETIRSAAGPGASTVVARGDEVAPGDYLSFRLNYSDTPTLGQSHMVRLEFFDGSNTNHIATFDRLVTFVDDGSGGLTTQFNARNFSLGGSSTVIPEPMTMTLLGMGLAGVAVRRFRAKK